MSCTFEANANQLPDHKHHEGNEVKANESLCQIETGPESGLQLGLVPYSVGQLGIGYQSGGWQVNLFASYHSGARRAFFNNPGDSTTDFSPSFLNLDLGLRIPLFDNLGLTVYLENLADRTYEKANRIYQPIRFS